MIDIRDPQSEVRPFRAFVSQFAELVLTLAVFFDVLAHDKISEPKQTFLPVVVWTLNEMVTKE